MASQNHGEVIGIPVISSISYNHGPTASLCVNCKQDSNKSFDNWMSSLRIKTDHYMKRIRDHAKKARKVERIFGQAFSVSNEEKLVKASHCFLSTTAGPIAGVLFISTLKVAFLGDNPISVTSVDGNVAKVPYKILVPLTRMKKTTTSEDSNKPSKKYLQMVTVDDFEFWFTRVASYRRLFKYLQQTISENDQFVLSVATL